MIAGVVAGLADYFGIDVTLARALYVIVSFISVAFPGTWAGLAPIWSWLCLGWGATVAVLALPAPRLQPGELRREVVEAQ